MGTHGQKVPANDLLMATHGGHTQHRTHHPPEGVGFCGGSEWVTVSDPPINLGWDWCWLGSAQPRITPHSIRSNWMLVDASGHDLGYSKTYNAAWHWIQTLPWQREVLHALREQS